MKRMLPSLLLLSLLAACSGSKDPQSYPQSPEDQRRAKIGKLTGEDGLTLLGDKDDDEADKVGSGMAVNSYLWRATLDTLSFLPLASADPLGGVIITDWYENPETPGERFKVNATILDKKLRADGVRVTVFRQKLDGKKSGWRDAPLDPGMGTKLEDAILNRARELKIANLKR